MALFTGHTITPDSALGGTQIERSLRFNKADNAYIKRTCTSEGNRVKWTWSGWVKRCSLGSTSYELLSSDNGGDGGGNNGIASIYFHSSNKIHTYYDTTSGDNYGAINDTVYRDTNSWYHIVWQVDAANSTSKIWVNGVEQSIASGSQPISGYNYTMNQSGKRMAIGTDAWDIYTYSNFYLAETHYSDGQLYAATDFGYTDAQTGQWRPKSGYVIKSNITYGTNGFWLDFRDATSTTTLGYDYSGNGNHWTLVNMSVDSGIANDSVTDTPTNNFPILNPLDSEGNAPSDGNLRGGTAGTSGWRHTRSTVFPTSGKWYWEVKLVDGTPDASNGYMTGIAYPSFSLTQDVNSDSRGVYGRQNQEKYLNDNSNPVDSDFTSTADGDILQYAWDVDGGKLYVGKNNSWEESANPSAGTNPNWTGVASGASPMVGSYGSSIYVIINFGQQPFSYTPPTGYASLSGHNRAAANAAGVVNPQRFFETVIYNGTGSTNKIESLEFAPDLVWVKRRNSTGYQIWSDTVRGASNYLVSNTTDQESVGGGSQLINGFLKDGFQVGTENAVNNSSGTYVAWCWKAGGAAVTNNDGSVASQVSANTEAGFSICTWTGTGSNLTFGHGLGKKPDWVITKARAGSSGCDWFVYHKDIGATHNLRLNTQDASSAASDLFNNTEPTSSVFSIGNSSCINENGGTYISYCWTAIPGFSAFGKYTGNGNADGPYVHLGFRPAWLLLRGTHGDIWYLYDNKRNTFNVVDKELNPNRDQSESSFTTADFLSNGFKIRTSNSSFNYNNYTYIYMAFAERPSGTMFGLDANAR